MLEKGTCKKEITSKPQEGQQTSFKCPCKHLALRLVSVGKSRMFLTRSVEKEPCCKAYQHCNVSLSPLTQINCQLGLTGVLKL
jgi:hypothetical protein